MKVLDPLDENAAQRITKREHREHSSQPVAVKVRSTEENARQARRALMYFPVPLVSPLLLILISALAKEPASLWPSRFITDVVVLVALPIPALCMLAISIRALSFSRRASSPLLVLISIAAGLASLALLGWGSLATMAVFIGP